jgi:hypothetical protein
MDAHSNTPDQGVQADARRYLIGSIRGDNALSALCPHAQTLFCWSHCYQRDVVCVLPCNRWGCVKCGPRKAKRLAYRIEKAEPNKLITLTVNPAAYEDPRSAYDSTRRQLAELSKICRKKLGTFEYMRVLETTKKGWPHYHLMARCPYIPQRTISTIWANLTSAPIVDIRQIRKIDNVFAYVVKYLCKQTYIPWTNRRTSWSKDFFLKEQKYEPQPLRLDQFELKKGDPHTNLAERFPDWILEQISPSLFLILDPNDPDEPQYHPSPQERVNADRDSSSETF